LYLHAMYPIDPSKRVDFGEFKDELHDVLTALSNKAEREWPTTVGSQQTYIIVLGHYRVALTAYETIRHFVAEKPIDASRKPEFVVSSPPLVRSILDALANVIFIFEHPAARTEEFRRRAWKEDFERSSRYRKKYGSDPAWKEFLLRLERREQEIRSNLGLTDAEVKALRRWPTLGAMISKDLANPDRIADDARRNYLSFLNDWFYKDFSSDTHLSPPGFYRRAMILLRESRLWSDDERTEIGVLRTKALASSVGLLLAMGAELEHELRFGMRERLVRIWTRLNYYSPDLREIYQQRPEGLLATAYS
jgi:hypothetical protein